MMTREEIESLKGDMEGLWTYNGHIIKAGDQDVIWGYAPDDTKDAEIDGDPDDLLLASKAPELRDTALALYDRAEKAEANRTAIEAELNEQDREVAQLKTEVERLHKRIIHVGALMLQIAGAVRAAGRRCVTWPA